MVQNTLRFINPQTPNVTVYPAGRVDFQAIKSLAVRGILNLHCRDLPRNPHVPPHDDVRVYRRTAAVSDAGGWHRRSGGKRVHRRQHPRHPCERSRDRAGLVCLLTGRVSAAGGTFFLDENTKEYRLGPAFRREAQNVGGLHAQDQWRLTPQLTFNYALRWELTGAATNPNEVYSGPTIERM